MFRKLKMWLKGMRTYEVYCLLPPSVYGVVHVPSRESVLSGVTKKEAMEEAESLNKEI